MENYVMLIITFGNKEPFHGFTLSISESSLTYRTLAGLIRDYFYDNCIRPIDLSDLKHFRMIVIDGIYAHQLFIDPCMFWPYKLDEISTAHFYPNFEEK